MSHSFFFFNDTATTEIYTLSLHDALPIFGVGRAARAGALFRNATVLEAAAKVDTVVFDKTGTLTEGRPSVTDVIPAAGGEEVEILRLAAARGAQRGHPLPRGGWGADQRTESRA